MADKASRETDELLSELEKELENQYDMTDKEIQEAIEEYLNAIYLDDQEDATQKKRLDYAKKHGLEEIVEIFVATLLLTNERAVNQINDTMNTIGDINYKYIQGKIKDKFGEKIGGAFGEYKEEKHSKRAYYRNIQKKYAHNAVYKEVAKSVKMGESYRQLSQRLRRLTNKYKTSAKTTAEREALRVKNEARQKAADRSGIDYKKRWVYTWRSRSPRHWHIAMDGETISKDGTFSNGLHCPGEAGAPAREVINCKCDMDIIFEE